MNDDLRAIEQLLLDHSGMLVRPTQHPSLRAAVARVVPGADPSTFMRLAAVPVSGRGLIARLIDEVTVQETYFLRDRQQLDTIDWELLHERARAAGSGEVRIWSAGCATGEEVYSLALLACEAFGTDAPPVRILGTDISPPALEHAREGSYRPRSVRELDPLARERWFEHRGQQLLAGPALRRLVAFARHNLAGDPAPPLGEAPFHLILCRNVLIYFDTVTAERVVAGLEAALHKPGILVLGAADALCVSGLRAPASAQAPARSATPARELRRPLGREPVLTAEERLGRAVHAADEGRLDEAIGEASDLIVEDPFNAEAHFLRGIAQLQAGDPAAAVKSLRGALYVFPAFGPAAFKLGRAYEELGQADAARRAYRQALRNLEHGDDSYESFLEQIHVEDIAAACRARMLVLEPEGANR